MRSKKRNKSPRQTTIPQLVEIAIQHCQAGRFNQAEQIYRQILKQQPNHVGTHNNLGATLREQGKLSEALARYKLALTLQPNCAEAYYNLGNVLKSQGKLQEALAHYQQAVTLKPNYAEAHNNLGRCLQEQGKLSAAIDHYQQSIAIEPNFAHAHFNLGDALLLAGDFRRGFAEYEWRWLRPDYSPRRCTQPLWDGSNLAGRTILLHAEQGFGDTIQFIRYAGAIARSAVPEAIALQGGRVLLECQTELIRLLETVPGINQLVARGAALPEFHVHAPLMSLPHILGTTAQTIPACVPYLAPPSSHDLKLNTPPGTRLKVGIVWAGSSTNKNDHNRSCALLHHFGKLLELPGIAFYSLQKGPQAAEEVQLSTDKAALQDLSDQLHDFADTASALAQLDLIITVDTAVAHLAGALGKPVWVLLSFVHDWRWMVGRDDSPWYPTMRLFRQSQPGDWESVLAQVAEALQKQGQRSDRQGAGKDGLGDKERGGQGEGLSPCPPLSLSSPPQSQAIALAIQHHQAGRLTQAEQIYRQILQQQPDHVDALNNLAVALHTQGKLDEAIAHYKQVLALNSNHADTHNNLAAAFKKQGQMAEAIAHYKLALAINPNYAEAHNNLGLALHQQGKIDEAIAHYKIAVDLKTNYAEAHFNLSVALLLAGDFRRGFSEYEWRWQLPIHSPRHFVQPLWDGSNLSGRTILLHAEQGFGDTIQFIRYTKAIARSAVPEAIALQGGRVVLECQTELIELLATVADIQQIIPKGAALPEFHVHAPLMSLPHILGTTLETVPASVPYIVPPESHNLKLDPPPGTRLKVGIVWAGSPVNPNDRNRSCTLAHFKKLLDIPEIAFYSLQKEPRAGDLLQLGVQCATLQDLSDQLHNFTDTASALAQLDLVITVDTAVAHLAGALGKPIWVLLAFVPDWRWMLERDDSPWYPTMRLFRQSQPGDWESVFARVAEALRERGRELSPTTPSPHLPILDAITPSPHHFITPSPKPIGIGWPLSMMTGWGVYGMNLTLQLLLKSAFEPFPLMPPAMSGLVNPLHQALLRPVFAKQQSLGNNPGKLLKYDFPVFHGLGNNFVTSQVPKGKKNVGVIFFEDTHLTLEALTRAKNYDAIVAGSTWNAEVLKGYGLTHVRMVQQGIDPTSFHPAPKSNLFANRFVIFSGGKLEYRKGQDIVISAFKEFRARHPEALLLTAWHNFWPQFMIGLEQAGHVVGLPKVGQDKRLAVAEWLVSNGLPADSFIDIGPIPNHLVGQILREADVAVFTNRCEGGTNLAAMESLACGIPTILSANTGHLDLIGDRNCYPLRSQQPVKPTPHFIGVEGWGESSVEEVVETLDRVYSDRLEAAHRGQTAAHFMQNWTWEKQVARLIKAIDDVF